MINIENAITVSEKIEKNFLNNNLHYLINLLKNYKIMNGLIELIQIINEEKFESFDSFEKINTKTNTDLSGREYEEGYIIFKQKCGSNNYKEVNQDIAKRIQSSLEFYFGLNSYKETLSDLSLFIGQTKSKEEFLDKIIDMLSHFLSKEYILKKSLNDYREGVIKPIKLKIKKDESLNKIYNIIKKESFIILSNDFDSREYALSQINILLAAKLSKNLLSLGKILKKENVKEGRLLFDTSTSSWVLELWSQKNERSGFSFNSYSYQQKIESPFLSNKSCNEISKIKKNLVLFGDHYSNNERERLNPFMQVTLNFSDTSNMIITTDTFIKEIITPEHFEIFNLFAINDEKNKIKKTLKNIDFENTPRKRL